jgi:hypothetical protein
MSELSVARSYEPAKASFLSSANQLLFGRRTIGSFRRGGFSEGRRKLCAEDVLQKLVADQPEIWQRQSGWELVTHEP